MPCILWFKFAMIYLQTTKINPGHVRKRVYMSSKFQRCYLSIIMSRQTNKRKVFTMLLKKQKSITNWSFLSIWHLHFIEYNYTKIHLLIFSGISKVIANCRSHGGGKTSDIADRIQVIRLLLYIFLLKGYVLTR